MEKAGSKCGPAFLSTPSNGNHQCSLSGLTVGLWRKEAAITGFVFHDFRHTCINGWRKDGHDYFKIMAASGHKTISVFKRYNMVDEAELRTLISTIDTPVDTTAKTENKKEVSVNA